MSPSYMQRNNFESMHSSQLQPQHREDPRPSASPESVVTDVAQLANYDPVLTNRVAATLLGIVPDTLEKMRQRKQGPDYFKTESGAIRYVLSDVLDYRAKR